MAVKSSTTLENKVSDDIGQKNSYKFPKSLGVIQTFISKETLFTFPSSRMGLGLAICADGGTIYFQFLWASFHIFTCETLKIESQLSIKAFENYI